MERVVARGKFLFEGERKLYIRGVSYGPFAPNSRGERYPEPARAEADFALMRELGANVVRTYVPPPPWMFELAGKFDLRLMVGIPWPFHMAFLDSREMAADIRKTIHEAVSTMREFRDLILAYSLGNEIRSDIVRWHGPRAVGEFLRDLYDIGKSLAPDSLFTYSNYPSAEYLDLSFLDFLSFNVYLHREADFRRYLTHLMASSGDRPIVLSETGMDTIREGEAHQADLLAWQARAAFEVGLSGFIVFAFTDEWHTGGAEITDWAFGLVTRERAKKQAFDAVGRVFKAELPPKLAEYPPVSIVVAAYNAERTITACLDSLAKLNYPGAETIVVDDGSTDATARITEEAGVRTIKLEHRGLSIARNAGLRAASGRYVAFIDADARADRDWLYHLGETIARRRTAAAGGPNFPPTPASARAAAIAAAPGQPREVRAGDDTLEQMCGCNMIVDREAALAIGGFDELFAAAGDDVDFSWRLADRGAEIADAAGAVVIHERRATLRAYLAQQRGYGKAEGLLFRKYPFRAGNRVYGRDSWFGAIAGGRVYHGAFGRGLFQTVYPEGDLPPLLQLPVTAAWVAVAIILIIGGVANARTALPGILALAATLACGLITARRARPARSGMWTRTLLAFAAICGPIMRSLSRTWVKWNSAPPASGHPIQRSALTRGRLVVAANGAGASIQPGEPLVEAIRAALIRRGLAVARTDAFAAHDLEIVMPPATRVRLNAFTEESGRVAIGWRPAVAWRTLVISAAAIFAVLIAAGLPWQVAVASVLAVGALMALIAIRRLERLPAAMLEAVADAVQALGAEAEVSIEDAA